MKKVRISESDFNRLVKRIINESTIPGLPRLTNLLKGASKTRAINKFNKMLSNNEIDDFIETKQGVTIKIQNGEQVLQHFIHGRLRSKNQDDVFRAIIKSLDESDSDDMKVMTYMTDYLLDDPKFLSKYKNLEETEQLKQLEEKYGETASEILTSKLKNKKLPENFVYGFYKFNMEAWATPKISQIIFWIARNPGDITAWGNFVRWLFTGTARNLPKNFKTYYNEMKQLGFSSRATFSMAKLVLSVGLENVQRWLVLSFVHTVLSGIVNQRKLAGTPQAEEEMKMNTFHLIVEKIIENWKGSDYRWVLPFLTLWPIAQRIIRGLFLPISWGEFADYVINKKLPIQRELITLDNEITKHLPYVV